MKNMIAAALAMLVAFVAQAAGTETLTRPTPGVTRVVFDAPGELTIRPGNEERIVIEAEPKVLAKLEVAQRGDTLTLRTTGTFRTDKGIRYTLTTRSLRSLTSEASGNAAVGAFSGSPLDVETAGSGNIALSGLQVPRLAVRISGSGNIAATGSGTTLTALIESAGTIDAEAFRARTVDARIEGSGSIRVRAEDSLDAVIEGSGTIEYAGKPKVKRNISGAGSVDPI